MSLVGRPAENHPQQVRVRGALEKVDDRRTPRELWDPLNERYDFTLDAAASRDNALCPTFFTVEDDGLHHRWTGHRVWCNPPYSDCGSWVSKAWREVAPVVVMLLPANRTEQAWWQELVEPFRDRPGSRLTVEFLRGRLRFDTPDIDYGAQPKGNRPPFGCCLLTWKAAA